MLFILHPARVRRIVSCLPTLKISTTAVHSANVAKLVKKVQRAEEKPCLTIAKNSRNCTIVLNPTVPFLPDTRQDGSTVALNELSSAQRKGRAIQEQEWRSMQVDTSKLHHHCLMLSKIRLTSLVVITTMGGYALAPAPFEIYTFIMCSLGTGLLSAAANSVNQYFEVPFDAQMSRTKNRVLVRGTLTPAHAVTFAAISGIIGLSTLYFQVNGLTAALGAVNLILYTLIYTPMKRISILNTWVGSIVGAIPPLMGWAGCVGDIAAPGVWIMSGILYAWQFPHFNALSWNLRPDYSRAGYRMMAVTNPGLCRRTALRYTAVVAGLSYLAPALDVTNWWFALESTPLNLYFLYLAWQFNRHSDSASSRKLFRFSLIHLPTLMILLLLNKKSWRNAKGDTETNVPTSDPEYQWNFLTEAFDGLVALVSPSI